jgi:hypothetical protein
VRHGLLNARGDGGIVGELRRRDALRAWVGRVTAVGKTVPVAGQPGTAWPQPETNVCGGKTEQPGGGAATIRLASIERYSSRRRVWKRSTMVRVNFFDARARSRRSGFHWPSSGPFLKKDGDHIMVRSIRVALGLLVAIVGLTLMLALALHAIRRRFTSFVDACRRAIASGSSVQAASRFPAMPRASASSSL